MLTFDSCFLSFLLAQKTAEPLGGMVKPGCSPSASQLGGDNDNSSSAH
jgi:hypothetical protein